jgi:hydrogenase nickel incorporation protein HypB
MNLAAARWEFRAVEFDEAAANQDIRAVRPGMEIFKVSAKSGEGMNAYLELLEPRRSSPRAVAAV